jgi:hypothetical protein
MTRRRAFGFVWVALSVAVGIVGIAPARNKERHEEYAPGIKLGDGKNGRVFKQWVQATAPEPVDEVRATLRRVSGGPDTFVNLRFGHDGKTFENAKRVYLPDDKTVTVSWNVGKQAPNGQPFYMNAYSGEVFLERISVHRR